MRLDQLPVNISLAAMILGSILVCADTNTVPDPEGESVEFRQGQMEASMDVQRGVWKTYMATGCILPKPTYWSWKELLQTKYGIEVDVRPPFDKYFSVDWVRGYNQVSEREIERHFGGDIWRRASRQVAWEYWGKQAFFVLIPLCLSAPIVWIRGRKGLYSASWCCFVAAVGSDLLHFRRVTNSVLDSASLFEFWMRAIGAGLGFWIVAYLYCRLLLLIRSAGIISRFRALWAFERKRWSR